jgi:hypothetical protein
MSFSDCMPGTWFLSLLVFVVGLEGCVSAPGPVVHEGTDYGRDERGVWVRGPWDLIRPSANIDDVIDQ